MRVFFSVLFFAIFTTVSVQSYCLFVRSRAHFPRAGHRCPLRIRRNTENPGHSYCLIVKCKDGQIKVGNRCRSRKGRSIGSENCVGRNKVYINDDTLNHPGPLSIECPHGYVFDENMQCEVEVWQPGSGSWETHPYPVPGRVVTLELRRIGQTIRYRKLSLI